MLLNLHVKNLAIIDEVDVEFKEGLNILTGETGAGKSIIIGSINLALGAKLKGDIVRQGCDHALVQLVFSINDSIKERLLDYDIAVDEDEVIITRKISSNGRSTCKINSQIVTVSALAEIASLLIDIHGQHDNQLLLNKKNHLDIVDDYGKEEILGYSTIWSSKSHNLGIKTQKKTIWFNSFCSNYYKAKEWIESNYSEWKVE